MFTDNELDCLISALKIYNDSNYGILNQTAKKKTIIAILQKIECYSVLTVFSKQEYTVMGMACECCIARAEQAYKNKVISYSNYVSDKKELQTLSDKIYPLAK